MLHLSLNFTQKEFGVIGCDQRILDNATFLCMSILEPIRQHYKLPINVHDGYRDPAHNSRVGGKPNSYHLFSGGKSAVDFGIIGRTYREVFDWIRLQSSLPFDKIILETTESSVPAAIHIQVDRNNPPEREAFVGYTGDSHFYTLVEVR